MFRISVVGNFKTKMTIKIQSAEKLKYITTLIISYDCKRDENIRIHKYSFFIRKLIAALSLGRDNRALKLMGALHPNENFR